MILDIRTIIIILGITHLMQVLVFYHQFKVNKAFKGIGWWLLWSAAESIGFGAMVLRNIPSLLNTVIVIQNVMIVGGAIFIYFGVRRFCNKTLNLKLIIPVFSLFLIGLLYYLFVQNNIQIRSIIISSVLAIIAFITAYSLYTDTSKSNKTAANFNAMIFLVHGSIFLIRALMAIVGNGIWNIFEPNLFNILAYFDALIVSLLWTFGFIIMLNQRLNAGMFEAKEDLRLIFNTSPDAAVISRLEDGLIVDVNEGYSTILGYNRREVIGKTAEEMNIWKNSEDRNNFVNLIKKQGYCENYEANIVLKNGDHITALISAKRISLQGIPHIISITRNITERKSMELELKESELRFRLLFENMEEGVAIHEMIYNDKGIAIDYRILIMNNAFSKHTNIPVEKALGALATELYQVKPAPYLEIYNKVVVSGNSFHFETNFDPLNKYFDISVIYTKPGHFATLFKDITSRKQKEAEINGLLQSSENSRKNLLSILEDQMMAQESLSISEARYKSLLTNLEAGIIVHAPDTSIIMSNQRASQLLGLSSDQMKGKLAIDPDWMFVTENKVPFQPDEYPVNQVIKKREPIRNYILGVIRPANKDLVWLTVSGFPVFDNDGEITEILISFIEITARIKAEEKLRESEKTFSEMFQKSPVTILLSIPFEGTVLDVNEAFLNEMGYSRDEVMGHTTLELGLFEDPVERQVLVDILKEKGHVYGFECRFRTKNGRIMTGLLSIVFIKIRGAICQLSTVIDINDRKLIEEELVNTNIFLRTLINAIPTPVYYKNEECIYTGVNKAFEDFFGKSADQIKGKTVFDIMPIEIAQNYHNKDLELFTQSGSQIYEGKVISVNSQIHDVVFHKAAIHDSSGKIQGLIGVVLDITERKLSEINLLKSEERYRSTLDNMMEGCQIIDFDFKYIYLNQAAVNHAKMDKELLLNQSMLEVYPQIADTELYRMVKSSMENKKSYYLENEFIYNNGQKAWFELSIQPVNEGVFILSIDITNRKQTELALQKNTERLQTLHIIDKAILLAIESPEEIIKTAIQYTYKLLNCKHASVDIFDIGKLEVKKYTEDKNLNNVKVVIRKLPEKALEKIEILGKGTMETVEDVAKSNSFIDISSIHQIKGIQSFMNVPLLSAQRLYGFLSIGWDYPKKFTAEEIEVSGEMASQLTIAIEQASLLNETKNYAVRLEKRVRDRTKQLVIANKELESFAYSVSHDLRAPLRHIDGFAQMLKNELQTESEDILHFLDIISSSSTKMGTMIDSLLNFSRLGRKALQKTEVDLNNIISQIINQSKSDAINHKTEWKCDKLPIILADYQLMMHVFENLISNAIKFTSKKEIAQIEIGVLDKTENTCTIFVKDNGAGFDPLYADKLFGVFQRLHNTEEFEGIGIGLANVKQIIKKHGGNIWAEGKIDEGATIYITI